MHGGWDEVVREVARALGLAIVPGALPRVVGTLRPDHPALYLDLRPRYGHWRLEVRSLDLPKGLGFKPGPTAPAIALGDPAFDAAVTCTGDCALLLAHLDADTRARVRRTCQFGVTYAGRSFVFDGHGPPDAKLVLALVDQVARTAAALLGARDLRPALASRAAADPEPGVRLRAALALLSLPEATAADVAPFLDAPAREVRRLAALRAPSDPRTEGVLLELLDDPDLEGIAALAHVGTPRALPALRALARRAFGLSEVARAAQRAVDAIRARHAEPGALSPSELRGGDLAPAGPLGPSGGLSRS